MEKGGQVSLFVIIALVIIGAIIAVQFFWDRYRSEDKITDPVYEHVQECVTETSIEAIAYTSSKGGYYLAPENALPSGIPLYLNHRKDFSPSQKEIEEQISLYVSDYLRDCLDFSTFSSFNVTEKSITASTNLNDDSVHITVHYPLIIQKGEYTENIDTFQTDIPVRMGIAHQIAQSIVSNELTDPYVCIDCFDYFSDTYDFSINALHYENTTYIITLTDTQNQLNDEPYVFTFANEYA